ncbi:hypothetical protein MRB53_001591 [Persea americana]|uniref:Uncharacterized protein n=1 Tax=Persea americana TaxID=3435 RepID=A0ACC2MT49_PERAE|nr:hypothetical protein MRB53_001591 [Persea americana]
MCPNYEVLQLRRQVAEFGKRASFLEGLVLQLAECVGIDPSSLVGGDGTSGGARDATSLVLQAILLPGSAVGSMMNCADSGALSFFLYCRLLFSFFVMQGSQSRS